MQARSLRAHVLLLVFALPVLAAPSVDWDAKHWTTDFYKEWVFWDDLITSGQINNFCRGSLVSSAIGDAGGQRCENTTRLVFEKIGYQLNAGGGPMNGDCTVQLKIDGTNYAASSIALGAGETQANCTSPNTFWEVDTGAAGYESEGDGCVLDIEPPVVAPAGAYIQLGFTDGTDACVGINSMVIYAWARRYRNP